MVPRVIMPRVIIIGAGVAGSTLGRALVRAGIPCRVFDSAPGHNRQPRGLGLWNNSQKCLEDLGLADFLRSHARFVPPAAYRGMSGAWLSRCSASPENLRRVACVEQNELLIALWQGSASQQIPDLDVAWGKQVVEISGISPRRLQQGLVSEPLVVKFSDGSYEEGDVVVGADGAHSVVRSLMFPHSNLMYTGKTCISAILDVEATEDPFETLGRSVGHEHVGIRAGAPLRLAVVPLKHARLFCFATFEAPRTAGGQLFGNALQDLLASEFRGWHAPIPAIVATLGEKAQRCNLLCETVMELSEPLETWSRGRATLVGDAAAPLSHNLAQGAAVAIEAAHELASALARQSQVVGALGRYEAAIRPRVDACRTTTAFTKMLAHMPEASNLMQYVPQPLNGSVFDAFLSYSLSGLGSYSGPTPLPPPPHTAPVPPLHTP